MIREDGRCYWCGGPNGSRFWYEHCKRPLCRTLREYWRSGRVTWYRCGPLITEARLAEFLRRMAHPKTARDTRFAMRFPHRAGRAHG